MLRTTSATYTLTGKPATATDARGNVTRFAYDLLDRRIAVTDPMSRVTQFTYTVLGQPYRTYNTAIQAGPLLEQAWTSDGLPASLKDANGNTTTFAYDRFDRLVTTAYPATPAYPGGTTETATYDANGNQLTRTTRAGATIRYGYDTLNRLVTKTAAASPVACTAAPSGTPTVTYSYDLAGRTTGVCDNSTAIPAIAGPNPTVYRTAYTYNALNQPSGVVFDPVPTPTLPSAGSSATFSFGYNTANQRTSFTSTDNAWIDYQTGPASTTGYTANALNQYACVGVFTPPCTGGVAPTYDANGNLTSDGTFTFGYDPENRLTSASKAGLAATYAFDAQGRRKGKSVTVGATTTTTFFVTDADNREVLEYDASGLLVQWFAYGLGPNNVLAQTTPSTRLTLVPDILGSTVALLDSGAGTVTRYGYRPFGASAVAPNPLAYTGQRLDTESDLYYYRARHYSPVLGRFLQPDPIGDPGGANLYEYVRNDPLNLVDPSGNIAWFLPVLYFAAAGGGISMGVDYGVQSLVNRGTGKEYDWRQGLAAGAAGAIPGGAGIIVGRTLATAGSRMPANGAIGMATSTAQAAALNEFAGQNNSLLVAALLGGTGGASGSFVADKLMSVNAAARQAAFDAMPLSQKLFTLGLAQTNSGLGIGTVSAVGAFAGNVFGNIASNLISNVPNDQVTTIIPQAGAATISGSNVKK